MSWQAWSMGLVVWAGCGGAEPLVRESKLPDVDRRPMSVSIVGVFEDGLLRADEWGDLGPALAKPLGGTKCDAFYSQALDASRPALASAIDHVTRASGVSDDLMAKLAPAAKGDVILLLSKGAHPPGTIKTVSAPRQLAGRNSRMQTGQRDEPRVIETEGSIDLAASFYSIREHRLVAQLEVSYPGDAVDQATQRFGEELAKRFPSMSCAGWSADAAVDEAAIGAMISGDSP